MNKRILKRFKRENRAKGLGSAAAKQARAKEIEQAKKRFGDLPYEGLLFMAAMDRRK